MKITFKFLALVALLGVTQSQALPAAQRSILEYMATVDTSSSSAQQVAACFSKFLPLLTAITTNFSTQYEACISLATQNTNSLIAGAALGKIAYMNETAEICKVFNSCANETDLVASFNCFAIVANDDVKTLYELANDVEQSAMQLKSGLNSIKNTRTTCTTTAENTYVRNTARMYDELDACLQQVPDTTNTTAAATTTTTTSAPTTTTTPASTTTAATVAGAGGVASVALNVVQTDCSNGEGTRTQTSPDGKQTQTQTGPGCQSQSSGSGSSSSSSSSSGSGQGTQQQTQCNGDKCVSSSSSSGSGSSSSSTNSAGQSQKQCSGAACGQWQPLKPLFTMAPMAPMAPMPTLAPLVWNTH